MIKVQKFVCGEDGTYNESKRLRYKEWKAKGLCVVCGDAPSTEVNLRCANCKNTKEQTKRQMLRSHYGITLEQYNALLALQNGNCATCGEYMNDPHVDHDHITNELRGLLCKKCNTALAMVNDKIPLLEKLIDYLRKFKSDI
jgi:hypothetical protein